MAEYKSKFSGAEIDDLLSKTRSSEKFTAAEKAKLAGLSNYDDSEIKDDISDNEAAINSHTANTSNPHGVTKAQIGLGNVDNTSDANKPISTAQQAALNNKVDKVSGKGLSTNDFTNAYKEQIDANAAGIATLANGGRKNYLKHYATTQTINGVTFTVNDDGTITADTNGQPATDAATLLLGNAALINSFLPVGKYLFSGCTGGSPTTYDLRFYRPSGTGTALNYDGDTYIDRTEIRTDSNMAILVRAGAVMDNVVFKPMLRDASIEDNTYQPYAPTNRELYEMILALQSGNSTNSLRSAELLSINNVNGTEEKE